MNKYHLTDGNKQRVIVLARELAQGLGAVSYTHLDVYKRQEYLFAKKDRGNIADDELVAFRTLAKAYARLTGKQVDHLLQDKDLTEVCHDD